MKALPRLSHPGGVDGDGHVLEPPDLWERYLEAPLGELYDLGDDPGEVVNRYDDPAYASIRSDLTALLDDVMNHDVRKEPTVGLVA